MNNLKRRCIVISRLICLWHIKHTDIRKKTLAGYEEQDQKILLHNLNELQQKDYESNKELRDWELKQ